MKILYIITQADGGGAQKYVLALAKHFGGMIAAGAEDDKLFKAAENLQLTTYRLEHLKRNINPWHDFWAVWEIRQLIKTLKPDVVHLNSTKAGVLGSFAGIGQKTKIVFTAHGFRFLEPFSHFSKTFYLALEKVASSYRDFIITVSDADKRAALENTLIHESKIQTIHNGIPPITFLPKEEARTKLNLPQDKKIVGVIANDYKTKGLDILIEAIKSKPLNGALIAIAGKTDNEKESSDQIKFLGFLENASQYLKAFDILAIPSRKEGFPFVALEAMQAGLPIVATKVGGIPEALGDAALLVEPEDPESLAEALERVLRDQSLANSLSQKASIRSKLFTEEKMLQETEKVYKKILGQ